MPTINAAPGASDANSYLTLAEANNYFASRVEVPGWVNADDPSALLIMATRTIDMMLSGARIRQPDGFYRIGPRWTGAPATTTQALAWPRISMLNRNGVPIAANVIPIELKDAVAELAGALGTGDRLVDNDVAVQGITSVKAGSVSLTFDQSKLQTTKILPDTVFMFLVPSWVTDEEIEGGISAAFDVL